MELKKKSRLQRLIYKAKETKKCAVKQKNYFEGYGHCLEATHFQNKKKATHKVKEIIKNS